MGKVKEQMQMNIETLIYDVPDGLDRIPIQEIQGCQDFFKRQWLDYLFYLDKWHEIEETDRI